MSVGVGVSVSRIVRVLSFLTRPAVLSSPEIPEGRQGDNRLPLFFPSYRLLPVEGPLPLHPRAVLSQRRHDVHRQGPRAREEEDGGGGYQDVQEGRQGGGRARKGGGRGGVQEAHGQGGGGYHGVFGVVAGHSPGFMKWQLICIELN